VTGTALTRGKSVDHFQEPATSQVAVLVFLTELVEG